MQVKREVTEVAVELSAREVPAEHEILLRELSTDVESGAELQIVAREHKAFEDYVREVRVFPPPITCTRLTRSGPLQITDEANIQDVKPRICQHQLCF